MNPILKLIGTDFSIRLRYNPYLTEYVVEIGDLKGNKAEKCFSAVEAGIAKFDMLAYTVEQCIFELQPPCKCGDEKCLGFLLLHEKELTDISKTKETMREKHGDVTFDLKYSPSSGEIFTRFYELHIRRK